MPRKAPAPWLCVAPFLLAAACASPEAAAPPPPSFQENLARARSWADNASPEVAASYLQRAYDQAPRAAPDAADLAWVEIMLGEFRRREGRNDDAEKLLRSGLARLRAQPEPDPALLARGLDSLGMLLLTRRRDAEALATLEQALALRTERLDPASLDTASTRMNLAEAVKRGGDPVRAERLLHEVEATYEIPGRAHLMERATIQNELGLLYQETGHYAEAEQRHLQALGLAARVKPSDNPNLAVFQRGLAGVYARTGRRAEAERLYRESAAELERLLGPEHPETRASREALAAFLAGGP